MSIFKEIGCQFFMMPNEILIDMHLQYEIDSKTISELSRDFITDHNVIRNAQRNLVKSRGTLSVSPYIVVVVAAAAAAAAAIVAVVVVAVKISSSATLKGVMLRYPTAWRDFPQINTMSTGKFKNMKFKASHIWGENRPTKNSEDRILTKLVPATMIYA